MTVNEKAQPVRWSRIKAFVGLTFVVTYAYTLFMALTVGYGANTVTGVMLQAVMLIPALVALALQIFAPADSPLHFRRGFDGVQAFSYAFLIYGLFYLTVGAVAALAPDAEIRTGILAATQFGTLIMLVFTIVLQFVAPKDRRTEVGLNFGRFKWYLFFGLLVVGMYAAMTALNYALGLGQPVDIEALMEQLLAAAGSQATPFEGLSPLSFLLVTGFQTILVTPFIALPIALGEEYGWRGFLQNELIKMGKVRGIAVLGIIWGFWHAPIIVMGHNYPGYPIAGVFLMTIYTVLLSFVFGLAVLKSGSVLLAAFLHALNNQTFSFLSMMVYKPEHPVFSFGVGIYGLVFMAIIVALLLRDREWRV